MKYLLDTNICVYIIKQKPLQVIKRFSEELVGEIGLSSITVSELYYGVSKSQYPERNELALNQFLLPLTILSFDIRAAREYGIIRAGLERSGRPIGPMDLLIAAHAKSSGSILVTNNEREFNRVQGLQVENWAILPL